MYTVLVHTTLHNSLHWERLPREVSLSMVASHFLVQGSSWIIKLWNQAELDIVFRSTFLQFLPLPFFPPVPPVQVIFVDGLMGDNWPTNASISDASAPEGYLEQLPIALHCFATLPSYLYQFNPFQQTCFCCDVLRLIFWYADDFFAVCQTPHAFKMPSRDVLVHLQLFLCAGNLFSLGASMEANSIKLGRTANWC